MDDFGDTGGIRPRPSRSGRRALEQYDTLNILGRSVAAGKCAGDGIEMGIAVCDERFDLDLAFFKERKGAAIGNGPPVLVERSRCAYGGHHGWLEEHDAVQSTHIHAGVAMAVQEDGGLLRIN